MPLTLYNTLTRRKEPFETLEPGRVQMYCCGVTVYDHCHLGHARSYVVWDTVRRYLQWRGYGVRYVQNFTDIDDKILKRARELGVTPEAVATRFTQTYFEDMARLNVLEADAYPRATQTLDGIKRLIYELEQQGYAYAANGDVYFAVDNYETYGQLSGRKLEDMQAGAGGRVSGIDANKKNPFDFALWKGAKPGEPAWESPWGPGRPGWHIECSAMVRETLGETIDIHMGGSDLIFPHHENEIAQSEAVTGRTLARYWLHNGMVNVGGEKMSKSLGNFTTIRQLLDGPDAPDPMALRLFILQAHYRKPLDFTPMAIASGQQSWLTLQEGLQFGYHYGPQLGWPGTPDVNRQEQGRICPATERFQAAMDDDFNTSEALAVLFELAKELRREGNLLIHQGQTQGDRASLWVQWQTLVELATVLGLVVPSTTPPAPTAPEDTLGAAIIKQLIAQRQEARLTKDFATADKIRHDLQAQGITLIDQPGGKTAWHRQ